MRRYDIVSGILLILSVIDFALAAPLLVQENHQACVDVVHIPKDVITVLGKRGDEELEKLLEEERPFFAKPESSSATRPSSSSPPSGPADGWADVKQPLPSIPEEPSPVSSPDHAPPNPGSLTESGYELMKGVAPPGPSDQASSTMSSADHELMGAHALPNPGPSTESDHEMMDVPLSSPVSSTNPDRQSMDTDSESPSGKRRKTEKGLWFTTRD
jgi:hypothetical protein